MLPTRRLMIIIGTILAMATIFLSLNISTNSPVVSGYVNNFDSGITLEKADVPDGLRTKLYYVIGDREEKAENKIMQNVIQTLCYMKLNHSEMEQVTREDLNLNPVLIFCTDKLDAYMSLILIGDYISHGGKVLFAAGLPESNNASYLYPIWGIIEKGNKEEANQFYYKEDAIPYYANMTVNYSGYNLSTNVNLNDQVNVLIEAENQIPIVFSHEYQLGKVTVINGSLMDSKYSEGILASALGELMGELIYPIIGTKTVFLDEYPPLQYLNQDISMEFYGRTTESFLRDVLWPKLLQSASLYDIKYTAGILGDSDMAEETLLYNKSLVKYLLKELLKYSGEVTIMGDFSGSNEMKQDVLSKYNKEFGYIFPGYQISGYAYLYGKADEKELQRISNAFKHLYTLRGFYEGDSDTQEVQNFEYKEDYVHFPVVSYGFGSNREGYDKFLCGLTLHGVVSHSFNIRSLLTTKEISWDNVSSNYDKLSKDFFGRTSWLKSATLSESAKNTYSYDKLSMTAQYEEWETKVYCSNFMKGQAFYLRTNREVKEVIGGSFSKINEKYYYIQSDSPEFAILY